MTAYLCNVCLHLPRPLFRKLMARTILERTDLSTIVIRAVRSELPKESRTARSAVRPKASRRPPGR